MEIVIWVVIFIIIVVIFENIMRIEKRVGRLEDKFYNQENPEWHKGIKWKK